MVGSSSWAFATWNARSLFHHRQCIKNEKLARVLQFAQQHTFLGVQETRGTDAQLRSLAHALKLSHYTAFSPGDNGEEDVHAAGGCFASLRFRDFPNQASFTHFVLIQGRAILIEVRWGD